MEKNTCGSKRSVQYVDKFDRAMEEHTKEETDGLCLAYKELTDFLAGIQDRIDIDNAYADVLAIMEYAKTGNYVDRGRIENMIAEDYKWQPQPIEVKTEEIDDKDYPYETTNN